MSATRETESVVEFRTANGEDIELRWRTKNPTAIRLTVDDGVEACGALLRYTEIVNLIKQLQQAKDSLF